MLLDLGLAGEAPIPGLSVLAYVTIDFLDPDEHGMSRQSEFARLMELEDALVPTLTGETSIFVGRCMMHLDYPSEWQLYASRLILSTNGIRKRSE